jgi:acyl carrier protein
VTRQKALQLLEETLDLEPHTLTGAEKLAALQAWDSLSTLAFIAMVDQQLGVPLPGNRVSRCQTVNDLLGLMGQADPAEAA